MPRKRVRKPQAQTLEKPLVEEVTPIEAVKPAPEVEEVVEEVKSVKGVIDSDAKAKQLVKSEYSHLPSALFLVLPNGAVYFGENRDSGRAYAKRNNLKTFDVRL